jgi:hypothetical protein
MYLQNLFSTIILDDSPRKGEIMDFAREGLNFPRSPKFEAWQYMGAQKPV